MDRDAAAHAIAHTLLLDEARDLYPTEGLRYSKDEQWVMLNLFSTTIPGALPQETHEWCERVGLYYFIPRCILACYAEGRTIPSKVRVFGPQP